LSDPRVQTKTATTNKRARYHRVVNSWKLNLNANEIRIIT